MAAQSRKYFVIFAAMRTGSNLLEKTLELYEGIGTNGELFNPSFIGKAKSDSYHGISLDERERRPESVIEAMRRKSGDNIPGFRIFDSHDARIEEMCLADPNCLKIVLQRDPVDSYVSLKSARATDQWMMGRLAKRRTAAIEFDAREFSGYLAESRAYYFRINHRLRTSGQSAFSLSYEDLHDREVLDGLVRYLGASGVRGDSKVSVRRQNPESLADRVENYPEMCATLKSLGLTAGLMPFDNEPERGPSVGQMVACRKVPLLVSVIPGSKMPEVLIWMREADGQSGSVGKGLIRPKSQKDLNAWLSDMPGSVCLSIVQHPLERAYGVFMRRIFHSGYPAIRRRLERHFELVLPAGPETAGYDCGAHRKAFAAFLEFVRANLSGQTGIRTDAEWASQTAHLEGIAKAIPALRVVRATELSAELSHLSKKFALPDTPIVELAETGEDPFTLAEIYHPAIEKAGRKAYAKDYLKLGFGDWTAGI